MAISLLIVDDHPVVRDGLTAMLGTTDDFSVVGAAATGTEAVRLSMRLTPDVALVDLELPPTSGIEVIANVLSCSPKTKVLVFTAFKNEERVMEAIAAGAHGYVLKGTPRTQLFEAIRTVHEGGRVFEGEVAQAIVRHSRAREHQILTARQQEIVDLLGRGLSNKEMAGVLKISERTVKYHLAAVFDRLGVNNRTEALAAALQMKLLRPREPISLRS